MSYPKEFDGWGKLKEKLHEKNRVRSFKQRQVWWCSIGVNIGFEIDGKSQFYNRPVLIIRKLSARTFWGVPLTTKQRRTPFLYSFEFMKRRQFAVLDQMRLYDASRLSHLMGNLPDPDYEAIKTELAKMVLK